jgi:hypothetical protein
MVDHSHCQIKLAAIGEIIPKPIRDGDIIVCAVNYDAIVRLDRRVCKTIDCRA